MNCLSGRQDGEALTVVRGAHLCLRAPADLREAQKSPQGGDSPWISPQILTMALGAGSCAGAFIIITLFDSPPWLGFHPCVIGKSA